MHVEKEERKRRDDLERKLRDQREREGRVLSLVVPIEGGDEGLRAAHAGAGRIPAQESRPVAQQGWEISTRPEYRAELDASSSIQSATRPYELEANSPAQQSHSNTYSGQRPMRQDQLRRPTQRFELMGDIPGQRSQPPQSISGCHTGSHQQRYNSLAPPLQPQERQRDHAPRQPPAVAAGHETQVQRPVHYPHGFFENPRTPPDIGKYNRPPSVLDIW